MNERDSANRSDDPTDGKPREFADSANPYIKRKKGFFGFLKRNRTLLIIIGTAALVVAAFMSVVSDPATSPQERTRPNEATASVDLLDKNRLLDNFLVKNMGGLQAEQLQSIRIAGSITDNKGIRQFMVVKKRPNLAYLKIYLDQGMEITYGMNGNRIWRRLSAPGGKEQETWATDEEAHGLQSMTYFFSSLIDIALNHRELVESIEFSEQLGFQTIAVQFLNPRNDTKAVAHIDPDDLSLLAQFDSLPDGRPSRTNFADFRIIDGFRFPFSITTLIDGEYHQTVEMDKLTLNPGVISDYFNPPGSLEAESTPKLRKNEEKM